MRKAATQFLTLKQRMRGWTEMIRPMEYEIVGPPKVVGGPPISVLRVMLIGTDVEIWGRDPTGEWQHKHMWPIKGVEEALTAAEAFMLEVGWEKRTLQ